MLKTGRIGDFHKSVTILSPESGIIQAIAHGAYKGKSRISSLTDPFCVTEFELYHNPAKDLWKITGCESRTLNSGIRENLNSLYNAMFWSELILKSHASGADFKNIYNLYTEALEVLNEDNRLGMILTVHFLYRFLAGSGFIPDFSECSHCGAALGGGAASAEPLARRRDSGAALGGEMIYFSAADGGFLCPACSSGGNGAISYASAAYLEDSIQIKLEEAVKKRLDIQTEKNIRNVLLAVLRNILGTPLNTLDFIDYGME